MSKKEQLTVALEDGTKRVFIPGDYWVSVENGGVLIVQSKTPSGRPPAYFAAGKWVFCATEVLEQARTLELEA